MKKIFSLLLVLGVVLALAACGDKEETKEGSVTPDKIVMGFVPSQDSDTIAETVEPLAKELSDVLGIEVVGKVMTDYTTLVEAMGANQVHIGFIPAFGYVQANEEYGVEVLLKSERYGSGTYKAQYTVRADSGIETLEDLKGTTWAFPDKGSTSGYLFPASQLMEKFDLESGPAVETEFFANTISGIGHDGAIKAVYEGDADVATTFNDARTEIEEQYPDVMEKLKVIGYTNEIPNDTISVTKELDNDLVKEIKAAFLGFNENEDMIKIMKEVYNWDAIIEASDEEYQIVRETYHEFKDNISL